MFKKGGTLYLYTRTHSYYIRCTLQRTLQYTRQHTLYTVHYNLYSRKYSPYLRLSSTFPPHFLHTHTLTHLTTPLSHRYIFHEVRQPVQVFSLNLYSLQRHLTGIKIDDPTMLQSMDQLMVDMEQACTYYITASSVNMGCILCELYVLPFEW